MIDNEMFNKIYDMAKIKLGKGEHTHSDIEKDIMFIANMVFNVTDTEVIAEVVKRYEENHPNVKVSAPDILAANPSDGKWFDRKKEVVDSDLKDGYFKRYRDYLRRKDFDESTISEMEYDCEKILRQCANPELSMDVKERKKRGLVVGDVQSGKTSNYMGLINLACDYGYKIIVLLAGMTDSLRQQTQDRIDEGFIGALSDTIGASNISYIGVGEGEDLHYAIPLTNHENDFKKFIKDNLNATSGDFNKPIVLVVKKNTSVLESVCSWLKPGKNNITCQNVLIIDDEADNASINTKKKECEPSTINSHIRNLFNNFPIASYVGYTATPFANIFVNPEADEAFQDLFPSDFIVLLNAPSNYFGAAKVFAFDGEKHSRIVRTLDESEEFFLPPKHKKDECHYNVLPESMKEAILCFLINNVVRTVRGADSKHRSMLVNISVYNDMHKEILDTINDYVNKLKNIIEQDSYKSKEDFIKNDEMNKLFQIYNGAEKYANDKIDYYEEIRSKLSWEDLQKGLYYEISKFEVVVINNRNKKNRFSYSDEKYKEHGARVIAIGGYVLSRGLTLEGLMISYFSRNSSAYDSLLQMCRWFGYRPGYEDLCRLYISHVNIMNFRAVIDAVEDLKMQFREMIVKKRKPEDFGLMVRESPDTLETSLLITSRNKMYNTGQIVHVINYGGTYADTSKLFISSSENEKNIKEFNNLIDKIREEKGKELEAINGKLMLKDVESSYLAEMIKKLSIPYANTKFDVDNLSEYIGSSNVFKIWDIVIATGDSAQMTYLGNKAVKRSFRVRANEKFMRIGDTNNRIIDPNIFTSGLDSQQLEEARKNARNRVEREGKGDEKNLTVPDLLNIDRKPLFVVYPLDLHAPKDDTIALRVENKISKANPTLGFAIGFPKREDAERMKYRANMIKIREIEDMRSEPEIDEEFYNED